MFPIEYQHERATAKKTPPDAEAQDIAKKLYGPNQKFGLMNREEPLCMQVTAKAMILQAETMPPAYTSAQDLYAHTLNTRTLLDRNLESLKLSPSPMNNQFETKLKNTSLNSAPLNFSAPPKTSENFFDSYLQMRRDEIEAEVQVGKVIGTAIKEVVNGFVEEVGNNIERVKREAFDSSNPKSLFYLKEKNDPS